MKPRRNTLNSLTLIHTMWRNQQCQTNYTLVTYYKVLKTGKKKPGKIGEILQYVSISLLSKLG